MKKCFSDPAVFKQLETDCYNAGCKGQVIDCSEFPAAEYRYFARLCGVYAMFKSKAISLEQAAAESTRRLSRRLRAFAQLSARLRCNFPKMLPRL